jgi:methyl-accepting chemotaxis protein
MSIRLKMFFGFAVIVALGLGLGLAQTISSKTLTQMYNELNLRQNTAAQIKGVLNSHYIWRHGLVESALTGSEFKGALDPRNCALGRWLEGEEAKKITDRTVLAALQKIMAPHTYIHTEAAKITAYLKAEETEKAKKEITDDLLPKTQEVISLLSEMEGRYNALINDQTNEITAIGNYYNSRIQILSIAVLSFCVFFAVLLTYWISEKIYWHENILDSIPFPLSITDMNRRWTFINRPFEGFLGKNRSAALGQPCSNWGAGICRTDNCGIDCLEAGRKLTAFSQKGMDFKVSLSYLTNKKGKKVGHIETVEETTEFMTRQREELKMANKINESIVDLSESISDISKKTEGNTKLSGQAASLAGMMKQNADKGNAQMDEMMAAVKAINQSSLNINNVIKVINDIAFQTNLLALNASVEAARVGDLGKGFAVVADEVRNLASRSAQAAQNTTGLIQDSIDKAALGVRIAEETAASLKNIVSGINDSNQIAIEIAKSSEEQSVSIQQINQAIAQVSQLVGNSRKLADNDGN